ncbi:MAG: ribonuclease E/G [Clostridiales bacterium]|jgi:ribonuclease G|nr:ribonuclease E/G [Clostridiales bacterium]
MKKIYIGILDGVRLAALCEDGKIIELIAEKVQEASLIGNVYIGKIERVTDSRFVFLNVGIGKNVFVYADEFDAIGTAPKAGKSAIIQITKDNPSNKGYSGTTKLSFKGQNLIVSEKRGTAEIGVSKKLPSEERKRLKSIMIEISEQKFDVLVRTRAENQTFDILKEEFSGLIKLIDASKKIWTNIKPPALVYNAGDFSEKIASDFLNNDIDEVITDNVKGNLSLFTRIGLEKQVRAALSKKVWLSCGGFLIIERTEACHVIDVNTGNCEKKNFSETVFETNIQAAIEIAAQIRLRNISGIIVVDFVDMDNIEYREKLIQILNFETKKDRISVKIHGFAPLGLVIISRKKFREPLDTFFRKEKS